MLNISLIVGVRKAAMQSVAWCRCSAVISNSSFALFFFRLLIASATSVAVIGIGSGRTSERRADIKFFTDISFDERSALLNWGIDVGFARFEKCSNQASMRLSMKVVPL